MPDHDQPITPAAADLSRILDAQRAAFRANPMPSADERIDHLKRLSSVLVAQKDRLAQALSEDFGHRSKDETLMAEILPIREAVHYTCKRVRRWMEPEPRRVNPIHQPAKAWVMYQPLGVVGIIAPWNYPIYLSVGPLISALAAGNRAMVKMSRSTPCLAAALKDAFSQAFPEDLMAICLGNEEVTQAFTQLPFDHIIFTGSTSVGRTVMSEAAKRLIPVLLELGGKSPVILHPSFPMKDAAERIAFGKCINAGQTCVAPDYVLCPKGCRDAFVKAFTAQVSKMYPTLLHNPDYSSVVSERQFSRVQALVEDARSQGATIIEINPAAEIFVDTRKMPVTLVLDATSGMRIMEEEIFGPVLPIVEVASIDEAIQFVNDRPRPLALYYFDHGLSRAPDVARRTHSGGMCINEVLSHVAVDDLPFGGVGASSMGRYHAYEGFLTLSNAKPILSKPKFYNLRYVMAPYDKALLRWMKRIFLR